MKTFPERPSLNDQVRAAIGKNKNLSNIFERLLASKKFTAACETANALAVMRLGYNDHGSTHVRIAGANSLKILSMLREHGVVTNVEKEMQGNFEDAQCIVFLGIMLHDVGNAIHRVHHEQNALVVAGPILDEVLSGLFDEEKKEKIKLRVLECIFATQDGVHATSIEAGVVAVADGTDCEHGRSRVPYKIYGKTDIHSISALAIKRVEITKGKEKPVHILVDMSNPAGMFQVQEILGLKIRESGLEQYVKLEPLLNEKPLEKTDLEKL